IDAAVEVVTPDSQAKVVANPDQVVATGAGDSDGRGIRVVDDSGSVQAAGLVTRRLEVGADRHKPIVGEQVAVGAGDRLKADARRERVVQQTAFRVAD